MNKRLRNLVVVIGVLFMIIGGIGLGKIFDERYEDNIDIVNNEMDAPSTQLLGELNSVYGSIEEEMKEQVSNTTNDTIYKDYYAGAYIEGNHLIICVTDKKEAAKDSSVMYAVVNNSLKETGLIPEQGEINDKNIQLKSVKYSYNELSDTQNDFDKRYEEIYHLYKEGTLEYQLLHSINGFAISQEKNSLTVFITDITDEKIAMFETLFGKHEYVDFEDVETSNIEETVFRRNQ